MGFSNLRSWTPSQNCEGCEDAILSANSQHDRARVATRRESVDDDDGREESCLCDEIADLGRGGEGKAIQFLYN